MDGEENLELTVNLGRHVSNIAFKKKEDVYLPIFEGISNALDAVDDAGGECDISVRIFRDDSQTQMQENSKELRVEAIEIVDNGLGFTQDNLASFNELNSELKKTRGGKGVGRFLWLKTFDEVKVTSIFKDQTKLRRRTFQFKLPKGITNVQTKNTDESKPRTVVRLEGYKHEFEQFFRRKRFQSLKAEILRHFTPNLMTRDNFLISLQDGEQHDSITKDDIGEVTDTIIRIKGEEFTVHHMRVQSIEPEGHFLFYCGTKRTVGKPDRVSLNGLSKKAIKLEKGIGTFYYIGFVTGAFLDAHVNAERTAFTIEEGDSESDLLGDSLITWRDIRPAVEATVAEFLHSEISRLQSAKEARIEEVFETELAGLEYLRSDQKELFDTLPVDATVDEIRKTASIAHLNNRQTTRRDLDDFIARVASGEEEVEEFKRDCESKLPPLLNIYKHDLAQYVQFRAQVLKLMQKIISSKEDGEKYLEDSLHSIVFPMRTDELKEKNRFSVENHNLWLFDDRFAFYDYVASDMQLSAHKTLDKSTSKARPDICVYIFSENINAVPFHSVVIVELKRPGRTHHEKEKDPVQQVYGYISEIVKRIHDFRGQEVEISKESTQFYCYVVCDTQTDYIKEHVVPNYQMVPILGGKGYFVYNASRKAYIQLYSPKSVFDIASERNKVFFEKLGLTADFFKN